MDLKRFQDGKWYEFPKINGVRLKIRALGRKNVLECLANSKTDKRETVDPGLFLWETFKKALQAWELPDMPDGLKHRRDEILETLFEDQELVDFVLERSSDSFEKESQKLEGELKNSESSQPG